MSSEPNRRSGREIDPVSSSSYRGITFSRAAVDVAQARAEPSSSALHLGAAYGGRPRRRPWKNLSRRNESPRGRLVLDREGRDLLLARPEWRREDDALADPRDPAPADGGPGVRPRSRCAPGTEVDPASHRGRPARGPTADAPVSVRSHPVLLPHPRPVADGGPRADPEGHGGPGPLGASRQARLGLVGRAPPAADHRDGLGRGTGGPLPRRAHDRARSARPAFRVAHASRAHAERRDDPLDAALPWGGGDPGGPPAYRSQGRDRVPPPRGGSARGVSARHVGERG